MLPPEQKNLKSSHTLFIVVVVNDYFIQVTDPNGYDNESIGSGETEEIGSSSSFAGEARLFSANTQTTQWCEGMLFSVYDFQVFVYHA